MTKILEHIRVLDLSQFLAGPHTTLLLAGLGAEVIRIDNPATGDVLSNSPVYYGPEGASFERRSDDDLGIAFLKRLRGKKAITLDLKSETDLKHFYKLVAKSDVVMENFSVGVTERLKIDWPKLREINPGLVYCSLTGFGATGPDRERRAYDTVIQALAGLMQITGMPGGPPIKAGAGMADLIASVYAFAGILAALYHKERTNVGQFVDVAMVDTLFAMVFDEPLDCYEDLGLDYQQGNRIMRLAPFNCFQTQDGWVVICCGTNAMWLSLAKEMGRQDLAKDPNWSDMGWRVKNAKPVEEVVEVWCRDKQTGDIVQRLEKQGVVVSPVHDINDLLDWPQLRARHMIETVTHPTLGPLKGLHAAGFPIKFSDTETGYATGAALPGTHTAEILAEIIGKSSL